MATTTYSSYKNVSEKEYNRRIRAWTMYDWANSAFATTILAVVLPVYYSQVAGATLPSASTATAYWSTGLSVSLFIVALMSPLLGTISDVMRGKKRFLAVFFGMGVVATGLLVFVKTGDWLLASILFIVGRIGFTAANVFYDALLPHIAKKQDLDSVSARGFAMGYLGGGILLAINIVMIQYLPGTWGPRLSFLSVAIWWGIFAIPLFRRIPEPPAATADLQPGETVVGVSVRRIWATLKDVGRLPDICRWYRHNHWGCGNLRRRARFWICGINPGVAACPVCGHPLQFDIRSVAKPESKTPSFLLGIYSFQYRRAAINRCHSCENAPPRYYGCRPGTFRPNC